MSQTVLNNDLRVNGTISATTINIPNSAVTNAAVIDAAGIDASKLVHQHGLHYSQIGYQTRRCRSVWFDLDNGNGTTIDDVLMMPAVACTILRARIVYVDATTGTVAAGSAKIGTTLGGAEIVAATNYENTKAVGTTTAMTLASSSLAAATSLFVRHTGVAATQAGQAIVEVEYFENPATTPIMTETRHIHTFKASATIVAVDVVPIVAPTSSSTYTVDVQKGNATTAFATILSAVVTVNSSSAARTIQEGTVSTTTAADGDTLQVVITASGAIATQGQGVIVTVWIRENP